MALALNDRVQQTGTANTTISFTLSGSVTGFQSFAVVGNGNTTYYSAFDATGNWEVGIGTYSTTGPTLTRTTILASSNSGSAVTFSGTVNVFVTYPAEKSVNLDGSGNVSALGTVSSGTWQGTTIGVAYGGTGVTSSSGANSVVLRDANQNVTANNFIGAYNVITAAGTTTTLTTASAYYQRISGSTTQTIKLPDATTMANGQGFTFDNDSSGAVSIIDNASGAIDTVPSGGYSILFVESNATSAGSWGKYALLPASYDFSTTTADFGTATITNATYQGNTIASGYGGTGLTTFTAANNALYSTSSSALAAGTLPIAAGGTSATTANSAFNALAPSQTSNSGKYLTTDGSNTSWATVASGASISNDTTTSSNLYPLFAAATSGTPTTIYTGNTKYLYKPSTGELTAPAPIASNGIMIASTTVGASYTIATGNNGFSVGPITVATGQSVTVSSGQRWVVI